MRLFIDSADTATWSGPAKAGLLYGATTNPLIFQREGVAYSRENLARLVDFAQNLGLNELQFQLTGLDCPDSAVEAFMSVFALWPDGIVAKVPFCPQTQALLSALPPHVPVTFTTGYAASQAVIATSRGAAYIAPYYGRLSESGADADSIVDQMLAITKTADTRVLVASLRNVDQIVALAARGHDTFTLAPALFEQLYRNPTSDAATQAFEQAYQEAKA